jgi:hypothetical protein
MKSEVQELAPIEQNLMAIGHGLPFHAQQPWMFSGFYILSHLKDHTSQYGDDDEHDDKRPGVESLDCRSSNVAALMAVGRLEWLLRETRPSLSERLSEQEVITLLDCFQGQIFSPGEFDCITSDLCDHLGVDFELYGTSNIAPLVDTLLDLSSIQKVALADALEQAWHRGVKREGQSPKEFFATLGIDLT